MARMPSRRVMRGVVGDAISDREEYVDVHAGGEVVPDTIVVIGRYRALQTRLSDPAPLNADDRRLLARATGHARIWRTGLLDAWSASGDKAQIKECRDDISRLETLERALGVTPSFLHGGPDPVGMTTVNITELSRRMSEEDTRQTA